MGRIKWKPIKVPLDVHKRIITLAKRQKRAIWKIIDEAIIPRTIGEAWKIGSSSKFDKHLWYLFKFTMSYGYLKACLIHADDYKDAYKLFEQRCLELKEKLGIDCEGVPEKIINLLTRKTKGRHEEGTIDLLTEELKRQYKKRVAKANEIIKGIMKQVILNAFE